MDKRIKCRFCELEKFITTQQLMFHVETCHHEKWIEIKRFLEFSCTTDKEGGRT